MPPVNDAFFFFQAEDGIRDDLVTGVQTCALPISSVRDFYAKLGHMRKQFAALREGAFETLLTGDTTGPASDDNTYAFARVSGAERAVVVLNNGSVNNTASVPVAAHFA